MRRLWRRWGIATEMKYTTEEIGAERERYETLVAASKAWWEGARPPGWSEADHIARPAINRTGNREKSLARIVSECVRNGW